MLSYMQAPRFCQASTKVGSSSTTCSRAAMHSGLFPSFFRVLARLYLATVKLGSNASAFV